MFMSSRDHCDLQIAPTLTVRLGQSEDLAALQAMHGRCGAGSLAHRFHCEQGAVPDRVARQLLQPRGGWSLVVFSGEDMVAQACAAPISEDCVEAGILVEDRWQRRGLGAGLLEAMAHEAATRGYESLVCETEPDNPGVGRALERAGLPAEVSTEDGTLVYTVALAGLSSLPVPA